MLVLIIYIAGLGPLAFFYAGLRFRTISDPVSNFTTLLFDIHITKELSVLGTVGLYLYGSIYPIMTWVIVSINAAILTAKLKQSSKWRNATTQANLGSKLNRQRNTVRRERRVTKTVVMIAGIFIICSLPISAALVVSTFARKHSMTESSQTLYILYTGISFIFSSTLV